MHYQISWLFNNLWINSILSIFFSESIFLWIPINFLKCFISDTLIFFLFRQNPQFCVGICFHFCRLSYFLCLYSFCSVLSTLFFTVVKLSLFYLASSNVIPKCWKLLNYSIELLYNVTFIFLDGINETYKTLYVIYNL